MKKMKKILFVVAICFALLLSLSGCGSKDDAPKNDPDNITGSAQTGKDTANEAFYEWKDNLIMELTSEGKQQTVLVIPARCEGFWGGIIDGKVETVLFEDDDDVELDLAFSAVDSVKRVTLPANLTVIPSSCFSYCDSLEEIAIPEKVVEIGSDAFGSCDALKTVDMSGTEIKTISEGAFHACESLSEIKLPEGLETICGYAFEKCGALTNITIPGSVKSIESSAFLNSGITDIYFDENVSDIVIDKAAFGNDSMNITAHVKSGSWMDQNREAWDIPFKEIIAE